MFHKLNILTLSSRKLRNTDLKIAPVKINRALTRTVKRVFFR